MLESFPLKGHQRWIDMLYHASKHIITLDHFNAIDPEGSDQGKLYSPTIKD